MNIPAGLTVGKVSYSIKIERLDPPVRFTSMRIFVLSLLMSSCMAHQTSHPERTLFQFTKDTSADAWTIQNDVVMGGRSNSQFTVTEEGHGRFSGHVSLENNGGFASIRHEFDEPQDLEGTSSFQLRIKGDGKDYTFRVKSHDNNNYYFQATFPTKTSEAWETISIPFASMGAMHHGEPVDVPNFTGDQAVEFQFLIGNGKEQAFVVELDGVEAL